MQLKGMDVNSVEVAATEIDSTKLKTEFCVDDGLLTIVNSLHSPEMLNTGDAAPLNALIARICIGKSQLAPNAFWKVFGAVRLAPALAGTGEASMVKGVQKKRVLSHNET